MKKTLEGVMEAAQQHTADAVCLWDIDEKLGVLIEPSGNILAAMDYRVENDCIARVQQSGSLQGRRGYGYCLYLHAMAALGPQLMLCADTTELTPSVLHLWERLFHVDGLCKQSLYGTPAYRAFMDETFDEGVMITNLELSDVEWGAHQRLGQLHERLKSGEIKPHLANWGFSLPKSYRAQLSKSIHNIHFTALQKGVIYNYLACAFQLERTQFTIAMTLPKRKQTRLVE